MPGLQDHISRIVLVVAAGAWLGTPAIHGAELTFSKDIAPIFYAKCVSCHRPGEAAPMSLIAYKDVRPWAASIREKVTARVMPPWHADSQYGNFRNDKSLSQKEIDTIVSWAKTGAKEGNLADMPALPKFSEGWQIGTPDAVFEIPAEFEIPARGTIDYQYFEVPTNFADDRWVQAGEIRVSDHAHLHHVIVSVLPPKPIARTNVLTTRQILPEGQAKAVFPQGLGAAGSTPAGRFNAAYSLVNWAIGEDPSVFPGGTAKRLPAGSTLIFQVHYTTNGTPGKDRSKIGLIFAKEPPRRELITSLIPNVVFAIPPGASNFQVEGEGTFNEDVKIWTLHPHMHLRGKDMTYTVTYPDGRSEIILRDPKFELAWQTDYYLKEPLSFPKGTKLHITAHYDNSMANPSNPDPTKTVHWGDQTWDEMMIGFFTYTLESPASANITAQAQR
jgi:Copper type II ascorbate-dependent monooxygenase, C-terminal domain